jgi:hypothetical protein
MDCSPLRKTTQQLEVERCLSCSEFSPSRWNSKLTVGQNKSGSGRPPRRALVLVLVLILGFRVAKTRTRTKIPCGQKKSRTINRPAVTFQMIGNYYGAFVGGVAGAFVGAGVGVELVSELLQPLTTALRARPNSTTKDSFFIGGVTFTGSRKSTSKYLPHIRGNLPGLLDEIQVLDQIAKPKVGHSALFTAQ